VRIKQTGTRGGAASIRIDDPNPAIEFVETDQGAPAEKYEGAVQADRLQINRRNRATLARSSCFSSWEPGAGRKV